MSKNDLTTTKIKSGQEINDIHNSQHKTRALFSRVAFFIYYFTLSPLNKYGVYLYKCIILYYPEFAKLSLDLP